MKQTELKRRAPLKARSPMKRSSKPTKSKSPRLTPIQKAARGQRCTIRVPGVCNGNPETTVLAHLNGAGMAVKAPDWQAAFACYACHAWLDGGYVQDGVSAEHRDLLHLQGVIRTQSELVELGLITINNGKG